MEIEFDIATEQLTLSGSLGLLGTELENFVNSAGDDLSGRDQAHAPRYQFHLAADWAGPRGLFARLETEGRDDFYWSDSHAERNSAYELVHARLGWRGERLEVSVFGRNLTDEDYGVRGFGGFGTPQRLSDPGVRSARRAADRWRQRPLGVLRCRLCRDHLLSDPDAYLSRSRAIAALGSPGVEIIVNHMSTQLYGSTRPSAAVTGARRRH